MNLESMAKEIHPLFSSSHWGMHVVDSDTKQVLYTHNASQLFIPASVAKLFTTAAALEILGPSHLFYTRVKASVLPGKDGVVEGKLYLVGGGDPSLTSEGLYELAKRVHEAGVRKIFGEVIVDDTLFDGCSLPIHGEWEDLPLDYSAEESSLSVNDNSVEVTIWPNPAGTGLANVQIKQEVPYCQLINQVITDEKTQRPKLVITRGLSDNVIEVTGVISSKSAPIKRGMAVHHPHEFAKMIFLKALQDNGITIVKSVSTNQDKNMELHEIASISSASLVSIINKTNKQSDNLSANLLLKYTNRITPAIKLLLDNVSIPSNECLLCDGSGLSRHSLVTPKQTVRLLEYMNDGPYKSEFADSLACAGGPGSLETRFPEDLFPGWIVRAKTGSMSGMSNLAGMIHLPDGRQLIFSVFINSSLWSFKETSEALDRLLWHVCK